MLRSLTLVTLLTTSVSAQEVRRPLIIGFDISASIDHREHTANPVEHFRAGVLTALEEPSVRDALLSCNVTLFGYQWAGESEQFAFTNDLAQFVDILSQTSFMPFRYEASGTIPNRFINSILNSEELVHNNPIVVLFYDAFGIQDITEPQVGKLKDSLNALVRTHHGSVHLIALESTGTLSGFTDLDYQVRTANPNAISVIVSSPQDYGPAFQSILATDCRMG
jgi:hypothetical protein